jgi:hypothetical protein
MTDTQPEHLPQIFEWKVPIASCRLSREDIKRIYRIIDEKQIEDRDHLINNILEQLPTESPEQFQARRERVRNACRTTITVTGLNGESIIGHGEAFLDSSVIPEKIATIYCDTRSRFTAFLNLQRINWTSILIDFTSPSPLNWTAFPSAPTPNNSNYIVSAQNQDWGTSLNARLDSFLSQRKTQWNWLHKQGTYDVLLFFCGLPLTLWGVTRVGNVLIEGWRLPQVLSVAVYVYLFFLLLNVFRGLFSYARWVFPKIEFVSSISSTIAHRSFLLAILIGIVGSAVWDAIKTLL